MTDQREVQRRILENQAREPLRLEESREQAEGYRTARVVALAMPCETRVGRFVRYKLEGSDNPMQPLLFSFDEPRTGALLCGVRIGVDRETGQKSWLDTFHSCNFPKWGPTAVRTYYPSVRPGVHLWALVELPPEFPEEWERWRLTCWGVMLHR